MKISTGNLKGLFLRFFKRWNAPYRLTIVNKESMEEALIIHLTKKSLYIFLSSVFVSLFLLFAVILLYTPLRYYIPGSNLDGVTRKELIRLKKLSDSLEKINQIREAYVYNLMEVANGKIRNERDTNRLSNREIERAEFQNENRVDRAGKYQYLRSNVPPDSNPHS
ncbi:MAG TPA: hypothetical protein PLP34_05475, partial [Chitinophagaceae bacterium]|nr:hypothetical protein [Chitinophagaceae bacterium]